MTTLRATEDVVLKPREDRRIREGHPWVFSNELASHARAVQPGGLVRVRAASGDLLGIGFYHPGSLIAVRLLARTDTAVDLDFLRRRLTQALDIRRRLFGAGTVYRLVHGESDLLPGLVVDRYGPYLSVQTFSAGMDRILPNLCDVLEELLTPAGIVERNASPLRTLEQLPPREGLLRGGVEPVVIEEEGVRFTVDLLQGQKTGFFLDQRENRIAARRYARGARVLDCFCNDGGFALHAALHGATSVVGVDVSADAVARAAANAGLNGARNVHIEQADVFDYLRSAEAAGARFDLVILDPPSFTKSRKTVPAARKGYRELNQRAMRLLPPGGVLITASCSHHIQSDTFLDTVRAAGMRANRGLRLLDWRGAAPDHPVLPGVPETAYLKCAFLSVGEGETSFPRTAFEGDGTGAYP
jgi:23S rRNA (cytosine1962-C5)-methyltransferase